MCRITGVSTGGGWVKGKGVARPTHSIRFGMYNIQNERNDSLELEASGMGQSNMGVGVFQEKKMTIGIYTQGLAWYRVIATPAPL